MFHIKIFHDLYIGNLYRMSIKYILSEYDDLNLNGFFVYISAKVAFFRLPKTEDHFTGHRYEIEPIVFFCMW